MNVSTLDQATVEAGAALATGMPRPRRHQLRILTDWDQFGALREPWDELAAASSAGPFMSHAWLSAWWDAFGTERQPVVVQAWRDGQLVAAAPLSLTREPVYPWLRWPRFRTLRMMSDHRTGFNGWLAAPGHDDAVGALLEGLRDQLRWSAAFLEPMPAGPALDRLVGAAGASGFPTLARLATRSGVALLGEGWDAWMSRRTGKVRNRIRSSIRKAEEHGLRLLTERDGAEAVLARILALSTRSWKARAGTALGARDDTRRFMRRLWDSLGRQGAMNLYLIADGDENVASSVVIVEGETGYGFTKDFNEAYAQLSPGRVLVSHLFRDQIARGIRRFDMLRSTEFIETLADDHYPLATVRLFPRRNLACGLMQAVEAARPFGQEWRRQRRRLRRRAGHKEA